MKKKILSLVLALAMVVSLFPGMSVTASAEELAVAKWVTVEAGAGEPAGGWSESVTLTEAFEAANGAEANTVTYVKLNGNVEISGTLNLYILYRQELVDMTVYASVLVLIDRKESVTHANQFQSEGIRSLCVGVG